MADQLTNGVHAVPGLIRDHLVNGDPLVNGDERAVQVNSERGRIYGSFNDAFGVDDEWQLGRPFNNDQRVVERVNDVEEVHRAPQSLDNTLDGLSNDEVHILYTTFRVTAPIFRFVRAAWRFFSPLGYFIVCKLLFLDKVEYKLFKDVIKASFGVTGGFLALLRQWLDLCSALLEAAKAWLSFVETWHQRIRGRYVRD